MKDAFIKAISYYLPEQTLTNAHLVEDFPEWSVDKIADKIGVASRHISAPDETAVDMAVKAAERLFSDHPKTSKEEIDFVILCTQSPDYPLPPSSCIIQHRLGLPCSCGAFDINLGCSGYVYGLAIAKGLIEASVAKNVLFITSETYSKYLHNRDKGNRTIFGDAATATLVSTDGFAKIGPFSLGTDGSGAENLIVKTGGARCPDKMIDVEFDENGNPRSSDHLYMNGSEIFNFSQKRVPEVIASLLSQSGQSLEEVDLVILHQANKFMLDFLRKKLHIDASRFFTNMSQVGNTVSNSIPIALRDAVDDGVAKGNILLCGFGVGYSWGACLLKID